MHGILNMSATVLSLLRWQGRFQAHQGWWNALFLWSRSWRRSSKFLSRSTRRFLFHFDLANLTELLLCHPQKKRRLVKLHQPWVLSLDRILLSQSDTQPALWYLCCNCCNWFPNQMPMSCMSHGAGYVLKLETYLVETSRTLCAHSKIVSFCTLKSSCPMPLRFVIAFWLFIVLCDLQWCCAPEPLPRFFEGGASQNKVKNGTKMKKKLNQLVSICMPLSLLFVWAELLNPHQRGSIRSLTGRSNAI